MGYGREEPLEISVYADCITPPLFNVFPHTVTFTSKTPEQSS